MTKYMKENDNHNLVREIETYLRKITRQIINIDTEEETLKYLSNSFISKINCDFVSIILLENNQLVPKAFSGKKKNIDKIFPLPVNNKLKRFLQQSMKDEDVSPNESCEIIEGLKKSNVKTWFNVPLIDENMQYGFCLVGYYSKVPLLEMHHIFDEFGKDVAVSISIIRRRERNMRKFEDTEWIKKISIDKTLEENVKEFTLIASKGLNAEAACFYLLDDKKDQFQLIYPVYGEMKFAEYIKINENNELIDYFPYLEKVGNRQLTMPIVIDLKVIGVLHIERNSSATAFTLSDHRMLRLIADYIAVLQENRQLYINEKEQRERLQLLLDYQQALVQQTVLDDGFKGITAILSEIFKCTVILLDRFSHPISTYIVEEDKERLADLSFERQEENILDKLDEIEFVYCSWPLSGVNSRLGYLLLGVDRMSLDDFDLLSVNVARNISSIQFIKQKLVFDANEQAKEALMAKLLIDKIVDKPSIIQYANLFQWDIFQGHRVTSLIIEISEGEKKQLNLLDIQMQKQFVWDHIMERLVRKYKGILTAIYEEKYLVFVPTEEEQTNKTKYWNEFYRHILKAIEDSEVICDVYLGIGNETKNIKDYLTSYEQSIQALNVVKNRFQSEGYALFEDLGSYTILHQLNHVVVDAFTKNQLGSLINYSEENDIDLVETLRVYLQNNGNAKSTAIEMYMHRSSLIYRIERIESLLDIDLNDFETRFNLMMALKLLDMNEEIKGY